MNVLTSIFYFGYRYEPSILNKTDWDDSRDMHTTSLNDIRSDFHPLVAQSLDTPRIWTIQDLFINMEYLEQPEIFDLARSF